MMNSIPTPSLSCLPLLLLLAACTEQVDVANDTSRSPEAAVQAISEAPAAASAQDPIIALRSTLMAAPLSVPRLYLAQDTAPPESPPGDILRLRARVRSEPDSHDARFALAEALRLDRDYAAAEQEYREAIRLTRDHPASHSGLARLLIVLDRSEEAAETLETALAATSPTSELYALRGAVAASRQKYDLAARSFRRAVDMDPASERGHFDLAFVLERQDSTAAAISALRRGLDHIPSSVSLRLEFAELLSATAAYEEAGEQLRLLLEADPALIPAYVALARIQRQRQNLASARKFVDAGLAIDASSVDLFAELGILLLEEGEEMEAISYLERAIYRDPDLLEACSALGRAYEQTGDRERAQIVREYAEHARDHEGEMRLFKTAIALDKSDAVAFFAAGKMYAHLVRPLAASQALEVGLQIIPDDIEALSNLGIVLLSLHQLPRAIETYERILALDSTMLSAYANLGGALLVSGELERAVATFERALEIKPDFAPIHMGLARAYEQLGRGEAAEASLAEFNRLRDAAAPETATD